MAAGSNDQDVLGGNGLLPAAWSYSEGTRRALGEHVWNRRCLMAPRCSAFLHDPLPKLEREREFEGLEAVELAYCQLFSLRIIGGYWWIVSCPFPRMILRKFVLVPTPLQAMELWTCKTLREIEPWHAFPVTAPLLPKHCHDASVGLIAIGPPRFKDFQVPATPAKLEETFARAFDIFGHLLKLLTIYTFLDLLISGSYILTCERSERLSCDTIGSLHTHLMQWPQRN